MEQAQFESLSYPIGRFKRPEEIDEVTIKSWIDSIESLPERLEQLLQGISVEDLELPYRPGSWTIRQVVHHIPDSHLNAYIRVKWALTEDQPTIKAYNEKAWAETADAGETDLSISLDLLRTLHRRWAVQLRKLSKEELERSYYHPDDDEVVPIAEYIGRYAWHGEHHLAHVKQALNFKS